MAPRSGRSTAPLRSGTSTGVSSSAKSLLRAAPADWTMLNSWESCCTGSKRFERVSTKKVTVPTVRSPVWTHQPPTPTAVAVVSWPACSPPPSPWEWAVGGQAGQLDDRQVPGRDLHRAHVGVEEAPAAPLEPGGLHVLATEGLDDAHPGDALLEVGQGGADAVPHLEVGGVGVALELDAGEDDRGQADEAEQEQLPRDDGQHHHGDGEQQGVADEHEQPHLHEL